MPTVPTLAVCGGLDRRQRSCLLTVVGTATLPSSQERLHNRVYKPPRPGTKSGAVLLVFAAAVFIELQSVANRKKLTYWY